MSLYQFEYDRTYDPYAPVIRVILRSESGNTSDPLPALIDTGADATIAPIAILKRIGAPYEDRRYLVGATGLRQSVRLYPILVQIGTDIIYGIEAVGYGNEVVLGRDVLNQMMITLEGPLHYCELRI